MSDYWVTFRRPREHPRSIAEPGATRALPRQRDRHPDDHAGHEAGDDEAQGSGGASWPTGDRVRLPVGGRLLLHGTGALIQLRDYGSRVTTA